MNNIILFWAEEKYCYRYVLCCSVQAQVIPWLLTAHGSPTRYWPHDICVSAPTGSGKTLAFVIPIVQVIAVIMLLIHMHIACNLAMLRRLQQL
jgi:hypothetical protein